MYVPRQVKLLLHQNCYYLESQDKSTLETLLLDPAVCLATLKSDQTRGEITTVELQKATDPTVILVRTLTLVQKVTDPDPKPNPNPNPNPNLNAEGN